MHEHFTSGAINKATLEYLFPSIASKENKYSCPHCKTDVTLRKGKVRVHHFAHKKEVSSCTYYTKPTRKHIIYDLKMALHTIYNTKRQPIWFMNKCINKNCGTETISVLSQNSMTCPILRFDKSSNYIVFENTQLQSREEIVMEAASTAVSSSLANQEIAITTPKKMANQNAQTRFQLFDGGEWELPSLDLLGDLLVQLRYSCSNLLRVYPCFHSHRSLSRFLQFTHLHAQFWF